MNKKIEDVLHVKIGNHTLTLGQIESNAELYGVELTHERWVVIRFVREYLKISGNQILKTHELSQELKKEFFIEGGYKYMYELFPEGPVNTICKLLDIEIVNTDEKQFGVIH